jgi:hypothetical protein
MPPRFYPVTLSALAFGSEIGSRTCVGSRRSMARTALKLMVTGMPVMDGREQPTGIRRRGQDATMLS